MRVAVVGAGGVGGYYAGVLARSGNEVHVLARGTHLAAIADRGLEIVTPEGRFTAAVHATADAGSVPSPDLVIVAVKSYSLGEVAATLRTVAKPGAAVLPLLNGVEAADRLAALGVLRAQIVGGVTAISAAKVAPGVVERRSPFQRVVVVELDGGRSARVDRLASAFAAAGVEATVSEEIVVELWRKLTFLASISAGCGLARTAVGPLHSERRRVTPRARGRTRHPGARYGGGCPERRGGLARLLSGPSAGNLSSVLVVRAARGGGAKPARRRSGAPPEGSFDPNRT